MGEAKRRKESDPNYGKPETIVVDLRPDKSQPAFSNLPPDTTSDEYLAYLEQHWDVLAGFAYESFLNEGRGALILDWDLSLDRYLSLLSPEMRQSNQGDRVIVNRQLNCPVFYLGERSHLIGKGDGWLDEIDARRLIQRHDPANSVVLLLCWGFSQGKTGHVMGRTLALAHKKPPSQLYIDGVPLQEFAFFAGSNEAPPPPPASRLVRSFRVNVEHEPECRNTLRAAYDKGFREWGKGAVLALPESSEDVSLIYLPAEDLERALGADVHSRAFQQATAIIDLCRSDSQVAVIVVDEGFLGGDSFKYYSFLFQIGSGDERR